MNQLKLNLFQRLTRRWEAVHPYNAAQVMRLASGPADDRIADAWAESLRGLGLGRVHVLDDLQFRHESLNGEFARYPLTVMPAGASIESYLSDELNRPFDKADEPPFRPFLLRHDGGVDLGVVYQHWIADSVSIRSIMQDWFGRLFDPAMIRGAPIRQPAGGYWRQFGAAGNWHLGQTLLANVRSHMRMRRARKVQNHGPQDYPVRVTLHRSSAHLVDRLRRSARSHGCKIQDLLLAAMAQVCADFVPSQVRRNRPDIAMGSIIDLRRHSADDLAETFGLFLGFTQVVCRPEFLRDWGKLVHNVATQNRVHKTNGLAQASMCWMATALALDPLVSDRDLYHFYRKELPLSGGLSNVNMNESWTSRCSPDPLREYWRISPTGPLAPLVFSTTTLGSAMTIALTCRESLMSAGNSRKMAEAFLARLESAADPMQRVVA